MMGLSPEETALRYMDMPGIISRYPRIPSGHKPDQELLKSDSPNTLDTDKQRMEDPVIIEE
jgi:hypothetical protein